MRKAKKLGLYPEEYKSHLQQEGAAIKKAAKEASKEADLVAAKRKEEEAMVASIKRSQNFEIFFTKHTKNVWIGEDSSPFSISPEWGDNHEVEFFKLSLRIAGIDLLVKREVKNILQGLILVKQLLNLDIEQIKSLCLGEFKYFYSWGVVTSIKGYTSPVKNMYKVATKPLCNLEEGKWHTVSKHPSFLGTPLLTYKEVSGGYAYNADRLEEVSTLQDLKNQYPRDSRDW